MPQKPLSIRDFAREVLLSFTDSGNTMYAKRTWCLISMAMCIVISILGGIIDSICMTYSDYKSNTPVASDFFKPNFIKLGLSKLGTNIISRFPINIIDRLVTAVVAYYLAVLGKAAK